MTGPHNSCRMSRNSPSNCCRVTVDVVVVVVEVPSPPACCCCWCGSPPLLGCGCCNECSPIFAVVVVVPLAFVDRIQSLKKPNVTAAQLRQRRKNPTHKIANTFTGSKHFPAEQSPGGDGESEPIRTRVFPQLLRIRSGYRSKPARQQWG